MTKARKGRRRPVRPSPQAPDSGPEPRAGAKGGQAALGSPAWASAGAVSATCFATYWLTHGSGPYWQDSGLFLAALKAGGGLLSPGYPVYLLLGRPFVAAFRLLLPGHSFAEAGNTFSALWAALAAGLSCLSIVTVLTPGYRFFRPQPAPSHRRGATQGPAPGRPASSLVAATLGGLLAGLSYSLWFQALTAEAYALNAFFAALVIFLFLRLGGEGPLGPDPTPPQRRLLLSLLLAHGLSCGNHPVTVVFLPALAWLAWTQRAAWRNRRLLLTAAGVYGASALLPYLYLPCAAAAYPANPFGHVTDPRALVAHMLGSQWTGRSENFGLDPQRFVQLPVQAWQDLFAVGLLGLLLGLARLWREQRRLLGLLAVVLIPAALLPILYTRGGEFDFWLLPFFMACFLAAGVGLEALLAAILGPRLPAALRVAGVLAVAVATLGPGLVVNPPLLDRSHDFVPEDFGRNLYRHLEPGAVFIASTDQENALTCFLEVVERHRPDVIRLDAGSVATPWYASYVKRRYPSLDFPASPPRPAAEMTVRDWLDVVIRANAPRRPIYVSGRPPVEPPAGLDWVPVGGLWKTAPAGSGIDVGNWEYAYRNPRPFDRPARSHAPERMPDGSIRREPYTAQIRRFHVQAWQNLGDWSLAQDRFAQAASAYGRALEVDPGLDHPGLLFGLGKALFLSDRNDEARPYLERAGGLLDTASAAEASLYLGQILAAKGDWQAASQRFENVRRLDPELWARIQASPRGPGLLPPGVASPKP